MNRHQAQFYQQLEKKTVQCFLCPRECVIKEGKKGFCFVRENIDGVLYSSVYGINSGLAVDPIEKKPLYHFYPGSQTLSFGTTGCNLACSFCQNWQLSKAENNDILSQQASPRSIAQYAREHNCASVAFTYNDPIVFAEYAIDTAIECHKLGLKTVAVTAGYIAGKPRKEFFKHMDAANIDLKAFSDSFYQRLVKASLQPVLDTLIYVRQLTSCWLEITNLLIPGENDRKEDIRQMTQWIYKNLGADVPVHFSAFHPSYQYQNSTPTPAKTCEQAREIARNNGLKYVYTGNIPCKEGSATFCHNCHKAIIKRAGFSIMESHLNKNQCEYCKSICSGIFA